MSSRFPYQRPRQHDEVQHALDVSLAAVQVTVDALSKVEDAAERDVMAQAIHAELQAIRALVGQLDCFEHVDVETDVPSPRRP